MRLGLIGFGTIGQTLVQSLQEDPSFEWVVVLEADEEARQRAARILPEGVTITDDIQTLFKARPEFVVEAASQEAVRAYAERILGDGISLMVLSTGAFADRALFERCVAQARKHQARVLVPTGAIAGLDAIRALAERPIYKAVLTTTKPPDSLQDAPYVRQQGLDLYQFTTVTQIFEGSPFEVVQAFPRNTNVALAFTLALEGRIEPTVRVQVDPTSRENVHELFVDGEVGCLQITVRNKPFPLNPKTSYLAALSAVRTLRDLLSPVKIGG